MLDLAFFGRVGLAILLLAITIVAIVNRDVWLPFLGRIVSTLSGGWQSSLSRARAQKARRESLYGWDYVESNAVLSQNGAGFEGGFARNENAVPSDQNQENQNQFEILRDYLGSHNLTDEQAITILALMRKQNGDTYLSANKIRDTVGGADADVKARVAELRPRPATPPPAKSLTRPAGGW